MVLLVLDIFDFSSLSVLDIFLFYFSQVIRCEAVNGGLGIPRRIILLSLPIPNLSLTPLICASKFLVHISLFFSFSEHRILILWF